MLLLGEQIFTFALGAVLLGGIGKVAQTHDQTPNSVQCKSRQKPAVKSKLWIIPRKKLAAKIDLRCVQQPLCYHLWEQEVVFSPHNGWDFLCPENMFGILSAQVDIPHLELNY